MIRPPSIIKIRWAYSTVDRRWAITNVVLPRIKWTKASWISASDSESALAFRLRVKGGNRANGRGFHSSRRSHERRHHARFGFEADVMQYRLVDLIGEVHVFDSHFSASPSEPFGPAQKFIFLFLVQNLAGVF